MIDRLLTELPARAGSNFDVRHGNWSRRKIAVILNRWVRRKSGRAPKHTGVDQCARPVARAGSELLAYFGMFPNPFCRFPQDS